MGNKICKIMLMSLTFILLTGCGKTNKKTVSMYDLRVAMLESDETFPEMISVSDQDKNSEELFSYVSDISYDKIEHFFLSYSSEGLADEIVVITVKDINDVAEIKNSLEEHKESRIKLYQQYQPKEQARAEQGLIFTKDQYVVLIISNYIDSVKAAFEMKTSS